MAYTIGSIYTFNYVAGQQTLVAGTQNVITIYIPEGGTLTALKAYFSAFSSDAGWELYRTDDACQPTGTALASGTWYAITSPPAFQSITGLNISVSTNEVLALVLTVQSGATVTFAYVEGDYRNAPPWSFMFTGSPGNWTRQTNKQLMRDITAIQIDGLWYGNLAINHSWTGYGFNTTTHRRGNAYQLPAPIKLFGSRLGFNFSGTFTGRMVCDFYTSLDSNGLPSGTPISVTVKANHFYYSTSTVGVTAILDTPVYVQNFAIVWGLVDTGVTVYPRRTVFVDASDRASICPCYYISYDGSSWTKDETAIALLQVLTDFNTQWGSGSVAGFPFPPHVVLT